MGNVDKNIDAFPLCALSRLLDTHPARAVMNIQSKGHRDTFIAVIIWLNHKPQNIGCSVEQFFVEIVRLSGLIAANGSALKIYSQFFLVSLKLVFKSGHR